MRSLLTAALALALPLPALAQQAVPSSTPVTSSSASTETQPTTASEETAPAAPTEAERVDTVEGKLTSLEEQYAETKSSVLTFGKLKFSGYVQARFQAAENSVPGVNAQGKPTVLDGFSVRRGRIKATYSPAGFVDLVLQIDAVPAEVVLKDAEVHLTEPWTGQKLELVVGQQKWPFGYEVVQSSSEREFPERTRIVRALAPSERDRGAKLNARFLGVGRLSVGVFDGNGTAYVTPGGVKLSVDNDRRKDVIGRLGFDAKWISGGVSGWFGKTLDVGNPTAATPVASTGYYDRTRVGADVQIYGDLLPVGATALKGEVMRGNTWSKSGVEQLGKPAFGWYALLVQNLGLQNAAAVRYDYFDSAVGVPNGISTSSSGVVTPASTNSVGTLGVLLTHYFDESIKVSAVYEVVMTGSPEGSSDPRDNLFTLQFQAKF